MEDSSSTVKIVVPPKQSFSKEWASDQKAFKGVPWGKAMMWIFLVSDTFVFSIFLISYMTVRFSTKAEWPNEDVCDLRVDLISEEFDELREAIYTKEGTLVDVADALTDLLVVIYGAGHAFGVNLDECFDEVQRSNMSKLGEDGKPIYNELGKVMKGPNYFKPDLGKFLK